MKINWKKLLICIAIPLFVGGLAAFLTQGAMSEFKTLNQPSLSPPVWVFPIVWTILYTLMGISSYRIAESNAPEDEKEQALTLYFYQLAVNFVWPILFFDFGWYLVSFLVQLFLWILVRRMIRQFSDISKIAAYLNIPYLVWLTLAAYLNFGVWWLNR